MVFAFVIRSVDVNLKDKDRHHIIPIVVKKQDHVLVNFKKYLLLWNFFFFTFRIKWVGQAMGNETFYWDGLNASIRYHGFR